MIARSEIEALAREIGEYANAERVVLFGSHAHGEASEARDVNFLVVAESDQPRHKRSRELYRRFKSHRFPVDILVYTPEEFRVGEQLPASFVAQVLKQGKTVYVR